MTCLLILCPEEGRDGIRGAGGVVKLVTLLTATNDLLLTNAAHALANAAQDSTSSPPLNVMTEFTSCYSVTVGFSNRVPQERATS